MSGNNITTIRVDHLCCAGESKIIRKVLEKDFILDIKISVMDRRVKVEHTNGIEAETIVELLNEMVSKINVKE